MGVCGERGVVVAVVAEQELFVFGAHDIEQGGQDPVLGAAYAEVAGLVDLEPETADHGVVHDLGVGVESDLIQARTCGGIVNGDEGGVGVVGHP